VCTLATDSLLLDCMTALISAVASTGDSATGASLVDSLLHTIGAAVDAICISPSLTGRLNHRLPAHSSSVSLSQSDVTAPSTASVGPPPIDESMPLSFCGGISITTTPKLDADPQLKTSSMQQTHAATMLSTLDSSLNSALSSSILALRRRRRTPVAVAASPAEEVAADSAPVEDERITRLKAVRIRFDALLAKLKADTVDAEDAAEMRRVRAQLQSDFRTYSKDMQTKVSSLIPCLMQRCYAAREVRNMSDDD
jgi:hypothetical protein